MPRRPEAMSDEKSTGTADKEPSAPVEVNVAAQALSPDLEAIRRFIVGMIARGAIAELIASVLALLQRMREINTELMRKVAMKSRKRPPSETLHRPELELPLMFGLAANDASQESTELEGPPEPPAVLPLPIPPIPAKRKKQKHAHGR